MTIFQKLKWHIKRKTTSVFYIIRFLIYPRINIKGIIIPVDFRWSYSILKAMYKKQYEGVEINIIEKTIESQDKILEIGTGIGFISTFCAKIIGNDNILTYEANPTLDKQIQKLYILNNVKPKYKNSLVSEKTDYVDFYFDNKDFWSSSINTLNKRNAIKLKSENINNIIHSFNPNYLIMDIEGYEQNLIPIIDFSSIYKIQVELHAKLIGQVVVDKLIALLKNEGFEINQHLTIEEQYFFYKA